MDSVVDILDMVFPLIQLHDTVLFEFLKASGVSPVVASPWVLTWFAHSVDHFDTVARLFDFFLATPPVMCVAFLHLLTWWSLSGGVVALVWIIHASACRCPVTAAVLP